MTINTKRANVVDQADPMLIMYHIRLGVYD